MPDSLCEQRTDQRIVRGQDRGISRRVFLALAGTGLLTACNPSPSSNVPVPTLSPTRTALAPSALISTANASQLKQLAAFNPDNGRVRGLAWSLDGRILAAGAGSAVQLWNASTGKVIATLVGHSGQVFQLAWSPDGRLLASGSDDNTLRIWDVQSHISLHILPGTSLALLSVAWSPDGQHLAAGCDDGNVQIWSRSTWELPRRWSGPAAPGQYHAGRYREGVYGVAWSPDGRRLAGTRYDGYVRVWEASTGELVRALIPDNQPNGLSWTSAGRALASSSDDGTVQLWDPVTYKNTRILQDAAETSAGWAYGISWSPDGHLLVVSRSSGLIQVYDARSGRDLAVLQGHTNSAWTAAWSPDGLRVASGGDDGMIYLWGIH